ncbi:hypothetical protein PO909_002340, partial [Leuciscus waleckii]
GLATGLSVSSSIVVGGSLVSASGLLDQDSTSARRSSSYTLAPTSLITTMVYQSTSSAGVPPPWSFVNLPLPQDYTPPASPRPFVPLAPALTPSSSTVALWIIACASVARAIGIAMSLQILSIALARRHSVCTLVSSSTCSASVSRPPGVINLSSPWAGCSLGPTLLLLLQVPPVSSLAPTTICSALVPTSWSSVGPPTAQGRAYREEEVL